MNQPPEEKILVLIGAGASHGARRPAESQPFSVPPLGNALLDYIRTFVAETRAVLEGTRSSSRALLRLGWADVKALEGTLKTADTLGTRSFEDLAAHLLHVRQELKSSGPTWGGGQFLSVGSQLRALHRSVAASMLGGGVYLSVVTDCDDPFQRKTDHYHELVQLIMDAGFTQRSSTFVSLNYDTLLEDALPPVPGEGSDNDDIPSYRGWSLLKLHGSINFWGNLATTYSKDEWNYDHVARCHPAGELGPPSPRDDQVPMRVPVMAYFAPGKPCHFGNHHLRRIRQSAVQAAEQCSKALIIGVHIPTADDEDAPLLEVIHRLHDKRVLYLAGPGEAGKKDAQVAEERYSFCAHTKSFAEGIKGGAIAEFLRPTAA